MSESHWRFGRPTQLPHSVVRFVDRLRGRPVQYDLKPFFPCLKAIESHSHQLRTLDDASILERSQTIARDIQRGQSLDEHLPEVFALVGEGAARHVQLRPYPIQMVGSIALHQGWVIEMQTGEGKTLVAVATAALAALEGKGVQVLTFNDYLARRDAEWMGPIYRALGLRVAAIQSSMGSDERRQAYAADVTYVTAKEAGFDFLRDQLSYDVESRVQRPFHRAIVDEADSILIDEARTPLVIAGHLDSEEDQPRRIADLVATLEPQRHFSTDEHHRTVFLTDDGLAQVEAELGQENLYDGANSPLLGQIHMALHARVLLQHNVDYIVRNDQVELVDEYTGRVVKDRHWPDGLQSAVEAKEGLSSHNEGQVLGSITLQHFFGLFPQLCGMTATARPEEQELEQFYGLKVLVLPPNRPCVRQDLPDRIFADREAKHAALVDEIAKMQASGRPVLVGTASVLESEQLAELLRQHELDCQVLNARTDELEAQIVAEAGAVGMVTISTNMAGRGTDIRLGGSDSRLTPGPPGSVVCELGGLYVIGTNRHESRRIDQQLRGRAGRQGDPGSSCFFVSLEDDLIVRYGLDEMLSVPRHQAQEGQIEDPVVAYRIDWAQRVIEGQNFEIRNSLWKYSSFIEKQRQYFHQQREQYVLGQSRGDEATECTVFLHYLDRAWAGHLACIADIRETIHLEHLGGNSPLFAFFKRATLSLDEALDRVDEQVKAALERLTGDESDLDRPELRGPSSTWTYLINDNPFQKGIESLWGSGGVALSFGAVMMGPIVMVVALYSRWRARSRAQASGSTTQRV
jgi:preprotein translocase subunit SecA